MKDHLDNTNDNMFDYLRSAVLTDVGGTARCNADAYCVLPLYGMFCVADGGGDDGEVASAAICIDIEKFCSAQTVSCLESYDFNNTIEGVRQAINDTSSWLYDRSQRLGLVDSAATFACVCFDPTHPTSAIVLHVGTVSVYRIRGNEISPIVTWDTIERKVLEAKIGLVPRVELSSTRLSLMAGDKILICSDGLNRRVLSDKEILQVVTSNKDINEATHALIDAAQNKVLVGGKDDITVVLIDVMSLPQPIQRPMESHIAHASPKVGKALGGKIKRKALFVGVNEYRDPVIQDLRYAVGDAALLFAQFKSIGYDAELLPNPTRSAVEEKIAAMTDGMDGEDDVFLFYFAGHGFVAPGDDERLFCKDDFYEKLQYHGAGISFAMLRDTIGHGGLKRIFILDACRANMFAGQRGAVEPRNLLPISKMMGESEVSVGKPHSGGHAIWRSCSPRQCAMELQQLEHGLFSLAIDRVMTDCRNEGQTLTFDRPFMRLVVEKMGVIARAEGIVAAQTPEDQYSGNWPSMVLISGRKAAGEQVLPQQSPPLQHHQPSTAPAFVVCLVCMGNVRIEGTHNCVKCGKKYVCADCWDREYRCCTDCAAKAQARRAADEKARREAEEKARLAALPKPGDVKTLNLPGGAEMEMIYCPPGEFMMGSPTSEEGRNDDETQHRVRLTRGFWLGKYLVTQRQWRSVMGSNPSEFKSDDRPVEMVSWDDCQEFIKKVNATLGCGARLPTEAEWEYACRAGAMGAYGGTGRFDEMGWFVDNSGDTTHPVGQKKPNSWGLCDMHGNVWEWCADWYGDYRGDAVDPTGPASGDRRVLRGGGWNDGARICRSAGRFRFHPGFRSCGYGFRLCCSVGPRGPGAEREKSVVILGNDRN